MKKQKWIRKGMAFVLSLAMVAGLVPAMSGGANKVQAATGTGTEPSVSAYATKEQLMTAFTPDSNGDATTIGKLVFGKNSSGEAQQWYILGKDNGVLGDNTILFATSPIATGQVFDDYYDFKTESSLWSDCDYSGKSITQVYLCHYGASDLRVALKRMATDTSYFTTAEQGLMNATTVTTKDTNNGVTYTTTDKLYALAADAQGDLTIKAGSSDSTVLAKSSYWSNGSCFWLRSPSVDNDTFALLADPGFYVYSSRVGYGIAVQPASNLNLSSVLFASSAKAASSDTAESGTIADGTAMTLRLNGTGKDIGTVTYNATADDIKATKGSTSQTVALVVQGKDGTNNWYYSKKIDASETVNASAIRSALSLSSDIDLSTCKIWLETTDSTENLIYAVGATKVGLSSITSVEITGIDIPVSYTALDTKASCTTTGVSSTTPQITWTPSDSTAGDNISYTASITLTAGTGYEFINSTTATVLGNTATSVTKNADGTLTVTYAFPATAKDKLISITPQAITVANGTAYDAMNLPATVNIVTEGNTVTSAQVTWDKTTPASGSYDPAVLTQQTVTLNGTVDCPDSIDANGVSLATTITITISAADTVKAPTANPTAGTYSKSQSVALTSSTKGATIYYTTDGSEPTITGGTTKQYTAPILVTGTEGQSITTTIKAIAVKNGMQDSSVETFTYTIHQIPVAKYASKTQLMDGTFAPNTDGTVVNYGKLVFGKNSSGASQEWYILGKDGGVSGDNTIIFAASPITTNQVFSSNTSNKSFDASFGVYASNLSEVYANHYGASDLRVALQGMATTTSYFTTAEQGLMNATTVTTYDTNNSVTYTTTDKLYALQGDYGNDQYLWAGTSDSTVLARSSYWSNGSEFWLRSPHMLSSDALSACPDYYVSYSGVHQNRAVQPASNLNLSSVLFASAAKAASSDTVESNTIASGTAMTLRFDGTGKNIGTVTYNTTTGDIKATKGSTEGDVALVVQGKDETNDWYYSKQITGTEVVNVTDIVSESNTPASIDLSTCKIWLETTDSTNNLTYAVEATETTIIIIHSVAITGIDTPVSNTALDTEASCATTGVSSTTPQITWTPSASTAGYNTSYTASITLTAGTGYEFTDSTTATVLGNSATSVTKNDDGTLTVTYAFPATAKRKIVSVAAPEVPTDNTFTTYYGYEGYTEVLSNGGNSELGKQAMVTLEGVPSTTKDMNVIWTVANANGAPYDRTPGAKNTFRWTIPASEFPNYDASACQGYDAATGDITGTVAITNKDYTPVTITGENVTVTYHGEDALDVSRYFTIDEHAGTPAYEVLENSTGSGTLEGATLTMTTLGTFVVKVSTSINDVYNKGEHTLTITVNKATPYIKTAPTATAITYGKTLADATLTGGSVQYSSEDTTAVDGSFAWKVDTTKPAVADSGKTAYKVVFTPTNKNYNTIETDITVTVNKAASAPGLPNSTMEVDYSKEKVSDITTLPEGWAWQDADKDTALTVGTAVAATAVYTGADAGNYETESVEISITRAECTHATTEVKNEKDATCTVKGYTGDTCCTVCGNVITAGTYINALGHDMTKTVSAEVKATCTTDGKEAVKGCSRCDHTEGGETIVALGHDFSAEFTVDKEATCAEAGSKSKHCSRCEEVTEVTPIDKLTTHNYVNGVCSVCDDIFKTTVDGVTYQVMTETGADGKPVGKLVTVSGNEIPQVAVAVTGTGDDFAVSDGKVTVPSEITGSGSEQTFVVTKLSENAFNGASVTEVVVPATVTEVGTGAFGTASTITFKGNTAPSGIAGAITETVTTVNVPEGVADSYREELDENANIVEVHIHTYADTWTYDETHHWHASTCGHAEEVSDKAEHTFGEWVTVTEATEDAEGVKERSCSCGYKETAKIDKLAHTIHVKDEGTRVEPTCEKKGSITYKCTKCGEVMEVVELDATGHKWDAGKVTKEATETAEGVKTYTCSVCGKTKTEAIPKKTATTQEPPKKGDVVADDKTSVTVEVTDVAKKEVEYKEPTDKKAKTVSIPATVKIDGVTYKVTKIDDNAFKNNKTVTKVTVGSNIKTIGKSAFSGATKLKTVKIGKNVTTIGSNAFKGCSSLTSVTLPSKATKIGANAFSGCKKLKTIKITSTKLSSKTVSKNAFKGLTKATTIKVPKKKLSAYKKLFKQKGLSSKVKVKGY